MAVVFVLAAASCDSSNGSNCEAGTSGCRCLQDDRCLEPLSCLSNVCVGGEDEDAAPPDAMTDAEPSPTDAGDASSGDDGGRDGSIDAGDAGDDAGDAGDAGDTGDAGEVTCEALVAPAQGSVNVDTTAVAGVASYGCELGFGIVGVASRTCQSDGTWTDSAPTCAPGDCESLTSPANGTVTTPNGTATGEAATYACNAGYVLDGVASRTCQTDSSWSDTEPSCTPVDCGALTAPDGGSVDTASGTTFGQSAQYACNDGHELQGDAMRACEADGSWSGAAPSCEPVDCGGLSAPGQGDVATTGGTTFGATATYSCDPGYGIVGSASRTCQANGSWSGVAPTCAPGDCEGLTPPEDGTVSTPSGTTLNAVATYACNDGHNLVGSATRTCQANGSWSGSMPMCQIVSCSSLPNPEDGTVSTPGGRTYGEVATYSCSPGHNRNGSQTRTCQANGQWSGSQPSCDIVNCGSLQPPNDGTVSTAGGTTYNQTASYTCRIGFYRSGSATRTCQASGSWSGSMPSCNDGHTEGLRLTQLSVGDVEFVRIMNRGAVTAALTGVRFELRDSNGTILYDFVGGTLSANTTATIGEGSVNYALEMDLAGARAGAVMLCAAAPCSSESVRDAFTYAGAGGAPALPSGVAVNAPVRGITASNETTEDFYRVLYNGAAPTFSSCDWSAAPQPPIFVESFDCGYARWTQGGGTFAIETVGTPDGSVSHLRQSAGTMSALEGIYYTFPSIVRPSHIEYWTQAASRTFMCSGTTGSGDCNIAATIYWDHVGNLCFVGAAAGPCQDTTDLSWSRVVLDGFNWVTGTADYWVNGTRIGDDVAFGTSYVDNAGMRRFGITGGAGRTDGIRIW